MSLFLPFRALGYVSDDIPFAVQRRGRETFITVSVGKAWQIYNASNLRLVLVGPQLKHTISALACKRDLTFAALRGTIVECTRVHRTGEYRGHDADIIQLMTLGDSLFSLGSDGKLLVWTIGKYDAPQHVIQLPDGFVPTCMAHPDTYLNKMVVGAEDGRMQLWNFSSGRCIHEFQSLGSAVRCITPSPALDVVGVGLADGRAVLHNLKFDEPVMQFVNAAGAGTNADLYLTGTAAQAERLAAGGACTSVAFRSGNGAPLMAVGGAAGVITIWDLESRKLHCTLRDAHDDRVVRVHFFPGEPVLLTLGADNAVKEWIFDGPDGAPRLLRFRSGHSAPPTVVRHYGDGKRLLSAGQDRAFRCFSTIQDAQSRELSQLHVQRRAKKLKVTEQELKLARIVALDACDVRERDWSNVITAHEGDTAAYVWRLQRYALGEHVLTPPPKSLFNRPAPAPVTSVCLSRCGNFGFVGTAAGRLDRYNMQSGIHRGTYERPEGSTSGGAAGTAHDGAIFGLAADGCNRSVVSAGLDGVIRVWEFGKRKLRGEMTTGSAVAKLAHHPGTGLLAAACDDLTIRMFDVEALRSVRRFRGHTDRVTDLQLSEDCRWLLSASMDGTIRVWDVPGARVLQVLRMGSPVTSLSLSPSQDLLATTHVERSGVYLWANQMVFGSGADVIPSETPINARLPSIHTGFRADAAEAAEEDRRSKAADAAGVTAMLRHTRAAAAGKGKGAAEDEEDSSSSEEGNDEWKVAAADSNNTQWSGSEHSDFAMEDALAEDTAASGLSVGADPAAGAAYAARDAAGAPVPLLPSLVTLSLLPRTQWLNLVHLDTISARNKPIAAPEKPKSAPFFLPTLGNGENAGRNPVFDAAGGLVAAEGADEEAAEGWGGGNDGDWGVDEDPDEEGEKTAAAGKAGAGAGKATTRVLRAGDTAPSSHFSAGATSSRVVALLRACSSAGDWTSLIAHLRGLGPAEIDRELRAMRLLEGSTPEEERDVALLFEFMEAAAAANTDFEFVQALLRASLAVHGEAVATRPEVKAAAARVCARLDATWKRLGSTLAHLQCMVGILRSMQA